MIEVFAVMNVMSESSPALPPASKSYSPKIYPKEIQRRIEKLTVEQWKKEFFETLNELSDRHPDRIEE